MSMMPLGELSPLAKQQLAAWEKLAHDWTFYLQGNQVRCTSCHIAVWRIYDRNMVRYHYTDAELLALKVAHLRQAHMDLDPDHA